MTLDQIYDEVKQLRTDVQKLSHRDAADFEQLGDHETRLRVLERVAWTALGFGLLSLTELAIRATTGV